MTRTPTAAAPAMTAVFIPPVLGCGLGFEPENKLNTQLKLPSSLVYEQAVLSSKIYSIL